MSARPKSTSIGVQQRFENAEHRRSLATVVLCASVAIVVGACQDDGEASSTPSRDLRVPVEVLSLASSDFHDSLHVSAVVQPKQTVVISAEAMGRVVVTSMEEGDRVERNRILARIDKDIDDARIALLQDQLDTVEREKRRTEKLSGDGLATPQQLEQAEAAVRAAALGLKQAQVGVGKTAVRSPITGHVSRTYVEVGSFVTPGAPIAEVVVYDRLLVEASVPESAVRYVTKGAEVQIRIPALSREITGVVERRAIVATPRTRTFAVDILVDNANLDILPGMRATVIIQKESYRDAMVVPRDAVLQGVDGQEAMVLPGTEPSGQVDVRKLTLGPARGNEVVVLEGLTAGERLVIKGHRSLAQGSAVRVVNKGDEESTPATANAP